MINIESKDNSYFKNLKKLKERKVRNKEKKYIIEGFRLVEEAIKANVEIEALIFNNDGEVKSNKFLDKYDLDKYDKYLFKDNLFKELSSTENPQGIIAIGKIVTSFKEIEGESLLLCDKLQDPGNLGTIIRTAHAAGVSGIILTKGTVDIYNDKVMRSTMGSMFYIPIIYDDSDYSYIRSLKNKGYKIVATSLEDSKSLYNEDLTGKVILTVGNEGNGVSEEVFQMADIKVRIPMPGGAESLNVGIATSIIIYEKLRQDLN